MDMTRLAITAGIVFAAYKWGNPMIRTGAVAVAAIAIAKRVPYVQEAI